MFFSRLWERARGGSAALRRMVCGRSCPPVPARRAGISSLTSRHQATRRSAQGPGGPLEKARRGPLALARAARRVNALPFSSGSGCDASTIPRRLTLFRTAVRCLLTGSQGGGRGRRPQPGDMSGRRHRTAARPPSRRPRQGSAQRATPHLGKQLFWFVAQVLGRPCFFGRFGERLRWRSRCPSCVQRSAACARGHGDQGDARICLDKTLLRLSPCRPACVASPACRLRDRGRGGLRKPRSCSSPCPRGGARWTVPGRAAPGRR